MYITISYTPAQMYMCTHMHMTSLPGTVTVKLFLNIRNTEDI